MTDGNDWRPDGWGWRARIGVIAPHADLVPDAELSAMAPVGVAIHTTRVRFSAMDADPALGGPVELASLQAYLRPPALDDAAALLADGPVSVVAYAFTSTGYLAPDADDVVRVRLEERTRGIPVVTTCTAAVQAMRALGIERIALIHPPWISGELNAMGAEHFRRHGVDVVSASAAVLPGGQQDISPHDVYEWASANIPDDAAAVFFGGNGFRVVGAIDRLERDLQRPVLSANQVLLWAALHAAGMTDAIVEGYGRLLATNVDAQRSSASSAAARDAPPPSTGR